MNKRTLHIASRRLKDPGQWGLLLFVAMAILPIVFSLGYATAYSVGLAGLLSTGFTGSYWHDVLFSRDIWRSFGLSLYIAGTTVLITLMLALTITLKCRKALSTGPLSYAIYLPLAIPATVAAFLVFQLLSGAGFLSRILLNAGVISKISEFPDLVNDAASLGIIAAHVGLAVPFFVILFHEIYSSERIDRLSDLARTLGASSRRITTRITVPILLRRGFANIALLFIVVLGSYEIPLLLGLQSPQMISVLTMRKYEMFDIRQKPEAFIAAILYTALVLAILYVLFRRKEVRDAF